MIKGNPKAKVHYQGKRLGIHTFLLKRIVVTTICQVKCSLGLLNRSKCYEILLCFCNVVYCYHIDDKRMEHGTHYFRK